MFDAEYARQSIAAMVAKSWILAVEARFQLALANDIVRSSEQSLELADDRLRVGKGDEYDLTLARASTESFRDAARQLALGYEQALRALETLLGRYPAAGRRRSRRRCRRCLHRCRPGCLRSCSNAGPT